MEITAYYVERVIGLNRKPPVIGRAISNKIFYKDDQSPEAVAEFEKDEVRGARDRPVTGLHMTLIAVLSSGFRDPLGR